MNEYLKNLPRFPGLRLPSFGFDQTERCTATQTADFFEVLAVAVLAFPAVSKQFAGAISGKLRHGGC